MIWKGNLGDKKGIEKGTIETKTQVILTRFDNELDVSILAKITGFAIAVLENILKKYAKLN